MHAYHLREYVHMSQDKVAVAHKKTTTARRERIETSQSLIELIGPHRTLEQASKRKTKHIHRNPVNSTSGTEIGRRHSRKPHGKDGTLS